MDAITRIVAEDGIQGLYAGMNGSLIGVASTNFAYFYWYTVARSLYVKSTKSQGPPPSMAVELALGAAAGALAQLFTIPVAVVTTRQQTSRADERKSLLATAREVIDGPDGVSGLWRGLKASLVLVINPAITYGAYERLRTMFFNGKANLRPWEAFCKFNSRNKGWVVSIPLTGCSTRRHVESTSDNRHTTAHRCQSWLTIQTTAITEGEAL